MSAHWHPIAAEHDLPPRHVYHAELMGQEFAVWRADDDTVNVWENRCLHRGVRLSIGLNLGKQLKCQYHGWRYASGTGACTYIPAHPANAPARTIRNRTYPVVRRHGLIWTSLAPEGEMPAFDLPEAGTVLRGIPVNAAAGDVLAALPGQRIGEYAVAAEDAVYFVQPVSANCSVIRGILRAVLEGAGRRAALIAKNEALSKLRAEVEASAVPLQELAVDIPPSPPVEVVPGAATAGRTPAIRVRVARKWREAEDVAGFALAPLSGALPDFEPGAHIDVHLPNGLIRQYSLTNGPEARGEYVLGVKREPQSAGGSQAMHEALAVGDVIAISAPRNNFPLAREGAHHLLIAGGIGVTPLLSMARHLTARGRAFALHHFVRSADHAAFADDLAALGAKLHAGLSPEATAAALMALLAKRPENGHVYICGPGPMLEAARAIAEKAGWPEGTIHFEYFGNATARDDTSSFMIDLARSALSLTVPPGKTIVEVLRENGVAIDTSCEQGACGTCLTTVLDGEPDHQDVFLSKAERASGACMMPCVSRAKSARLTLDL
jgi:ferredoxin-NADP reductase/nitrite reductase/ring-hydroxylating ferredoxin subunit